MQFSFRRTRTPDTIDGVKIPYDKTRRGAHRLAWYLVLCVVLSPILYLGARAIAASLGRTANGSVDLGQLEVRAGEFGAVHALNVNPGDRISTGEVLAVLDSADLAAAIARNAAQLADIQAATRGAQAQRSIADQELAVLEHGVQYQRERHAAIENLFNRGAATRAELDQATADLAAAELTRLRTRRELQGQVQAPGSAQAERQILELRRGALTIHAPFDGRALAVLVKPGQFVAAGETMMVIARLDQPRVIAYVSPKFATHLEVGTAAAVYFPDGTRLQAAVAAAPKLTARMPPDLVDQFGLRPMTVMLELLPQQRWPDAQRVQGMPVVVRFESPWENHAIGAWLGRTLGWFAR